MPGAVCTYSKEASIQEEDRKQEFYSGKKEALKQLRVGF